MLAACLATMVAGVAKAVSLSHLIAFQKAGVIMAGGILGGAVLSI